MAVLKLTASPTQRAASASGVAAVSSGTMSRAERTATPHAPVTVME